MQLLVKTLKEKETFADSGDHITFWLSDILLNFSLAKSEMGAWLLEIKAEYTNAA